VFLGLPAGTSAVYIERVERNITGPTDRSVDHRGPVRETIRTQNHGNRGALSGQRKQKGSPADTKRTNADLYAAAR